jgi:hypothetical protein
MNRTPELPPDDDVATGDDLSTGVNVSDDNHVAWMTDDLPRAQGVPYQYPLADATATRPVLRLCLIEV